MCRPEEVERGLEEVTINNKDFKNTVEVFHQRLHVEFKNFIESFKCFLRQSCIIIDLNDVKKEGGGDRMLMGLEAGKD